MFLLDRHPFLLFPIIASPLGKLSFPATKLEIISNVIWMRMWPELEQTHGDCFRNGYKN